LNKSSVNQSKHSSIAPYVASESDTVSPDLTLRQLWLYHLTAYICIMQD